jgi:UDP-N-acetylmuramoyl-tripeptide--D-alanyl-D-alanine ligase
MVYLWIFALLGIFLFTFFALPTIYQFQIKEYNWDRLRSSFGDKNDGFFIPMKMPAKSLRNLLIVIIVFLGLLLYYGLITYIFAVNFWLVYLVFWFLGSILSKLLVFVGTLLTQPLATFHRNRIINKAHKLVEKSEAKFIGITGSYGKSSVKEMLYDVLDGEFNTEKSPENLNTDVGISLAVIQRLKDNTQYFIAEMGAYKLGEIKDICDIVKPQYGILTALGNQHLDLFGSKENLVNAKAELLRAIPKDGFVLVNVDCDGVETALEFIQARIIRYSMSRNDSEIFLKNRLYKKGYVLFTLSINKKEIQFKTRLPGKHSIQNLMPVIGIALELGVSIDSIRESLLDLDPIRGKLSLHKGTKFATYINDSYNSSFEGFLAAIEYLDSFEKLEKVVLSKGIIELGHEKRASYRKILDNLIARNIPMYTTDKLFYELEPTAVRYYKNENLLSEALSEILSDKNVVLVEGRFSPSFVNSLNLGYE